jgi:predicted permease
MMLRPSNRWATLIDGVRRDVRYAYRSFLRAPMVALTIVTTVGLGLGLVAVVFTILNGFIFQADAVRNPDELFAVTRPEPDGDASAGLTYAEYEALIGDTTIFSAAFANTPDVDAWVDGRRSEGRLVTGNVFQVLGVGAVLGRALTPADDEPGAATAIVLSHRAWSQHFASDPDVVGRTLRVNETPFVVVGVMPEGFRGLRPIAAPDFWAPLSSLGRFGPWYSGSEGSIGLAVVGRLLPGLTREQALAQLRTWDLLRRAERTVETPPPALALEPSQGTIPLSPGIVLLFIPLFFAFGLILVMGCANVANLLLARAVARQREIGIRLAIGASRRRIVRQLLTENLLLSVIAAAVGFGISRFVLDVVVRRMTSTFPPEVGDVTLAVPPADWRVGLFLLGAAVISTLFFAVAPAFQATRLELVRTMHGEVGHSSRPGVARNPLITLQVTGAVLLLICAAVFLRSAWTAASIDPGIRTDDIVTVGVLNEQSRRTILDLTTTEPTVASIAAARPGVLGGFPAVAEGSSGRSAATFQLVSPEYFDVLGVDLVRGRGFAPAERGESETVAIVSESMANQLWPGQDAIGRVVRVESDPDRAAPELGEAPVLSRSLTVVGIARDVPGFGLGGFRLAGAGIYAPTNEAAAQTSLLLRVRGNAERARNALVERLAAVDPNMAQVSSLQAFARAEAYLLGIPFWLTLALGALALFLTVTGLFSVLSYVVEQRMREFGVRTALGATRARIGALVLSQVARPVGIGLLIGSGLVAAVGGALLATPAAGAIGSLVRLFDPVAYAAGVLCVVATCIAAALVPALRAGRIDPVAALRAGG